MNFVYPNLTKAWEGVNELFLTLPKQIFDEYNGIRVSKGSTFLYHLTFMATNPVLDPNFDFGRKFNYTISKWKSLLGNYVHLDELQEFKTMLHEIHTAKPSAYSLTYIFTNSHKNGKGCLMQMVATRRIGSIQPYIHFYLRASEITKRLAVDFLLCQRLIEFIYEGLDRKPYVVFDILQAYADDTILLMYNAHKDVRKFLKRYKGQRKDELIEKLDWIQSIPPGTIKYKVHERAYIVIRDDLFKDFYPTTLAKDCTLDQMPPLAQKKPPTAPPMPLFPDEQYSNEELKKKLVIPIPTSYMIQNPQLAVKKEQGSKPLHQAQPASSQVAQEPPVEQPVKRGPGRPRKDPNAPPKPPTTKRQLSARIIDVQPNQPQQMQPQQMQMPQAPQQPAQPTYPGQMGGPQYPGQMSAPMFQPQVQMPPVPTVTVDIRPSVMVQGSYDVVKTINGTFGQAITLTNEELFNLTQQLKSAFGL